MQRYLGTARSRVDGYGWAPAMGMRSVKCLAALGQPWERPWYAHFLHPPLPKRLGKPKSEDSKFKLFKHIEAVSPY